MVSFNFTFDAAVSLEQRVAFELAARIWGTYLTDDVDVNLHIVSTEGIDGDAVGGAIPLFHDQLYGVYQGYLEADITPSENTDELSIDQQAVNSLQNGNTAAFVLNDQVVEGNTDIALTSAQAKALGMDSALLLKNGSTWSRDLVNAQALDGYILINQNFDWSYEFLRENKAKGKTLDFLSMAMHEIGHTLGFVSGIDGAIELESLHAGNQEVDSFTALDLFRFSSNSADVDNPDGSVSDISVGGDAYFSVDGGQTNLADFSTGQSTYSGGDGYQASHWKRLKKAMGLMDPTLAYKERLSLSLLDLQAMDTLGWDVDYSALETGGLDLNQLLGQAETAVADSLGIDSALFSDSKDHNDLYQLGYGAVLQQFEAKLYELGFGAILQELEVSFAEWREDENLLKLGFGAILQQFEDRIYELGFGAILQSLESEMYELGFGAILQSLDVNETLFQYLDAYFESDLYGDGKVSTPTKVLNAHVDGQFEGAYKGGADDDILSGSDKHDRIDGGAGDDFLDGKEGHDVLFGGAGKDIIYGHDGDDVLRGGEGNDLIEGEAGHDELYGDEGHDVLIGNEGEDLLEGGRGRDELKGEWGNDVLSGSGGDDLLKASSGDDIAVGGDGNDRVNGGSGDDTLYGDRTGIHAEEDLRTLKKQFIERTQSTPELSLSGSDSPADSSSGSSALNPIRIEAESMSIFGLYDVIEHDGNSLVRSLSNTIAETTFSGPSGSYMVLARYVDDEDGNAAMRVGLNNNTLDEWILDKNDDAYHTRTVAQSVTLRTGDSLSFTTTPSAPNHDDDMDDAYIDYIELVSLDNLITTPLDSSAQSTETDTSSSLGLTASDTSNKIRVEAESMILQGEYFTKSASFASGNQFIETGWNGTGHALTLFNGEAGLYDIVVGYYDESDGESSITANLNDSELDSWLLDLDLGGTYAQSGNFTTRTVAKGVMLNQDDVFKLTSVQHDSELARVDYVDFVKVATPPPTTADTSASQPADGLLAHWSFDEVVGRRAVDSVGSANGTLYNTESTDWTRGAVGNAFRFDGVDEIFHVSETSQFDTGNNSDFSVAFWTKLEEGPTGEWRNLIFKGTSHSDGSQNRDFGLYLHPDSNRVHYRISTTGDWNDGGDSQAVLQENQWYHIAYVKEGDQLSLHINNQKDSSVTLQGSSIDSGGELWAGNTTASTLDDLKIYNRALSSEDISELTSAWEPGGFDDTIQGGKGNDVAFGGIGRDVIYGDYEDGSDSAALRGAQFFEGSVYSLSQAGTWAETQSEAQSMGGNLVTLNTQAEEQLLQDRYGKETAFWIGISDAEVEGQWEWVSGEAATYTNWAPGQPDGWDGGGQDYGYLNFSNGQWDDGLGDKGGVVRDGVWHSHDTAGIIELSASYDDTLFGGSGDDALYGNLGNDYLYGESLASSLNEGLIAHWIFDEASGLSRWSMTGAHSGTLVSSNGSSGWTEGVLNSAIDFGGNITQMRVADSDELDITRQITIATWLNGDEFENWDGLVTKGTTTSPYSLQVMENGQLRFEANHKTGGTRNSWKSAGAITEGQWHHVAVTYDGAAVRFYIDGQLDANVSYAEFQLDTNDEDLVLGADLPGDDEFLDGQMDETRLYNRALSGTEIAKLAENSADTFEYNGSTYLLTSGKMTWTEAQAEAERLGGNLVTVNDGAERKWLNNTFGWDEQLWLGLNDAQQENNWKWSSGEDISFTYWAEGDPDNYVDQDYTVMNSEGGKWTDTYEEGSYRWNGNEWIWQDGLRGIIEIKPPEESQNDVIIAGVGNDTAIGGLGDDIINGSDALAAGYFERDQLWGGVGADTFVLGDQHQAYYQGRGDGDYALVKDLDSSDTLQLHGSAADYTVEQKGADASLYYKGDLVAIFEGTTYTSETANQHKFV